MKQLRWAVVRACGAIASCSLSVFAYGMGWPYYTIAPFSARIIDAETGQPVAGAIVVAEWELVRGSLDGERHVAELEVAEAVTGADGRLSFAGFSRANSHLAELRDADPRLMVFKSGYYAGFFSGTIKDSNYGGPDRKSDLDGAVLKLGKLRPTATSPQWRSSLYSSLIVMLSHILEDCSWPKIPKMLIALDQEKTRVNELYPGTFIPIGLDDFALATPSKCRLDRDKL